MYLGWRRKEDFPCHVLYALFYTHQLLAAGSWRLAAGSASLLCYPLGINLRLQLASLSRSLLFLLLSSSFILSSCTISLLLFLPSI